MASRSLSHARSGDVFGRLYVRVFQYVRPYVCVGVFLIQMRPTVEAKEPYCRNCRGKRDLLQSVFLVHLIRVTLISRRTHGHARSHLAAYLGVSVSVCVCVCVCVCACVCVCVRAYAHIFHANSSTHTHVCAGVISKRTRWPPG
jgi:hypothetical protein